MCAPVVMDVILSVILVITTITTPIMVTTFSKLTLPGLSLLRGRSDHEQGVHTLTTRAACSHGVEETMGSFALALDDLQRLYLMLLVIGS